MRVMTEQMRPIALCFGLMCVPWVACSGSVEEGSSPTPTSFTPTPVPVTPTPDPSVVPAGCTHAVHPGDDDQTAVQTALILATSGSVVCLVDGPFTFIGELSIDIPDLTLRGIGEPVLDFSGQVSGGNGIAVTSDGFVVEDLIVSNPAGDGIRATAVSDVVFRRVKVRWDEPSEENGGYGLYPVSSTGVTIEDSVVAGASDAGIYVGQSTDILVLNNEVYENVAGIEIENSTGAEVAFNHCHDNTGGILVFNLPGLPVADGKYAYVHDNIIEFNNGDNFAPEGNIVGLVPPGTGVMVLASDFNEFADNHIEGNISIGIVIMSYDEDLVGPIEDETFDKYPEGNYVRENLFKDNGTDPKEIARQIMIAKSYPIPLPAMLWDGCEDSNKDNSDGALTNCFVTSQ